MSEPKEGEYRYYCPPSGLVSMVDGEVPVYKILRPREFVEQQFINGEWVNVDE